MLTPLSHRPFHSITLFATNLKDKISYLFFKTLSLFHSTWDDYSKYYSSRLLSRKISLHFYPNHLIQSSFNRLYPGKICQLPNPAITNPDYTLSADIPTPYISGLCKGACIDYMNRVKNSKTCFWETIKSTALKFEKGCTKKGFLNHHSLLKIDLTDDWAEKKIENPSFKDVYLAKTISFFAKNYKCKLYSEALNRIEELPEGDYFVREIPPSKGDDSHLICLYKRKEGIVIYDPNYGTLYFENNQKLIAFLDSSTKRMFNGSKAQYTIFHCKTKEDTC